MSLLIIFYEECPVLFDGGIVCPVGAVVDEDVFESSRSDRECGPVLQCLIDCVQVVHKDSDAVCVGNHVADLYQEHPATCRVCCKDYLHGLALSDIYCLSAEPSDE